MKVNTPLVISVGSQVPISVIGSALMCPGLNAQYLGGYQASDFAQAFHTHDASDFASGVFIGERIGNGSLVGVKALFSGGSAGSESVWRSIAASDISGVSSFIADHLLPAVDAGQARSAIGAATAVHTHTTADVTSGVFDVARVGSGSSTSAAKILFGSNVVGGSPQWRTPGVADIQGAVGFAGSPTVGRLPIWSTSALLGSSPVYFSSGFVGISSGSAFAIDDNQFYVGGVKLPKPPSDTQLYGLRAGGATGASWEVVTVSTGLPSLPTEDGPYVLVRDAGVFTWRKLVGDGVGIN